MAFTYTYNGTTAVSVATPTMPTDNIITPGLMEQARQLYRADSLTWRSLFNTKALNANMLHGTSTTAVLDVLATRMAANG
jgi:hypothetical protein